MKITNDLCEVLEFVRPKNGSGSKQERLADIVCTAIAIINDQQDTINALREALARLINEKGGSMKRPSKLKNHDPQEPVPDDRAALKYTLCWDCENACAGCAWSRFFKPVPGWMAEQTKIKLNVKNDRQIISSSYRVIDCPEFERDAYGGGMKRSPDKQQRWLQLMLEGA